MEQPYDAAVTGDLRGAFGMYAVGGRAKVRGGHNRYLGPRRRHC